MGKIIPLFDAHFLVFTVSTQSHLMLTWSYSFVSALNYPFVKKHEMHFVSNCLLVGRFGGDIFWQILDF